MERRAILYVRASTGDQRLTLADQERKLRAYALALDLVIVGVEVDAGESARSLDRPALQRALAALDAGEANTLVVAKLDRLTRSVRDLGVLCERWFATDVCTLVSLGESVDTRSAAGRLVLNVLVSVAQWERETIGERTSIALAELKRQGKTLGRPRKELTREAVENARAEGLTWRQVAEKLGVSTSAARLRVGLRPT